MSGDLISRSRLLETLNYNKAIHEDESGETRQLIAIDINKMIEYVEKMPAAYDVDKVVEQLEDAKSMVPVNRLLDDIIKDKPKELGQLMAYDKAIKIVKAGGAE